MKINRWRYFWTWFLVAGLFVYIGSCVYLFLQPKIYETSALFETTELYPGENPKLPTPPQSSGIAVERIVGTRLARVIARDEDPKKAADEANEFVSRWFGQRRIEASERQIIAKPDSAEVRKLEIERHLAINIGSAGMFSERAEVSRRPSYPQVQRFVAISQIASVGFGLVIAFLMARRRGDLEDDGPIVSRARIVHRFGKLFRWVGVCYFIIAAAYFVVEPEVYVSSTTIKVAKLAPEDFETQLEILRNADFSGAFDEFEVLSAMIAVTEMKVEDILEFVGDSKQSTIEIRCFADSTFAEGLTVSIAKSYSLGTRDREIMLTQLRKQHLQLLLSRMVSDDPLVADIRQELSELAEDPEPSNPVEILETTPAEKLPRDWLGWLTGVAIVEVLKACTLSAIITIISLLWFSSEAKNLAEIRYGMKIGEKSNTDIISNTKDPY